MISYRLSATDFERAVVQLNRFAERPRQSAYQVLVEGSSLQEIAAQQGISREAVRKAVNRVLSAWNGLHFSELEAAKSAALGLLQTSLQADEQIPNGWEPVVVLLPQSMARTVRNLETQQLRKSRR